MSRPRTPSDEPTAMATMDLDLDLGSGDGVALAVEEATMGTVKVGVGEWEEDVEELLVVVTFVAVV